jgi:hypothetical protein
MSANLSNYDITLIKGDTFTLDFSYTDSSGVAVDLSNYTAKMQIRRSAYVDELLGELTEAYPLGSFGLSGDRGAFLSTGGQIGYTGGIVLNYNGITGNIYIEIDSDTTKYFPIGRYIYDLQLTNDGNGKQETILRGSLDVISTGSTVHYPITQYQGDTFILQFNYLNDDDTAIDISGYSGEMRIMRSPHLGLSGASAGKILCRVYEGFPSGIEGSTTDFYATEAGAGLGAAITGGMILNYKNAHGIVYIQIDKNTLSNMPSGRHFYNIKLDNKYGEIKTILEGTFDLSREITR